VFYPGIEIIWLSTFGAADFGFFVAHRKKRHPKQMVVISIYFKLKPNRIACSAGTNMVCRLFDFSFSSSVNENQAA
jgi:hypothetical protein